MLVVVTVGLLCSCEGTTQDPEPQPQPERRFAVDSLELNYTPEADTQTIQILSDGEWTLVSDAPEWCTVSTDKENGDAKVKISVVNNYKREERSTVIVVKRSKPTLDFDPEPITITVNQQAYNREDYFKATSEVDLSYALRRKEQQIKINVACNVDYKIAMEGNLTESGDLWLSLYGLSEMNSENKDVIHTHLFTVKANSTYQTRRAKIMLEVADSVITWDVVQRGYGDRESLELLYLALAGEKWKAKYWWNSDAPLNKWYGVRVDEDENVIELDLSQNGLCFAIPEGVLGKLMHLKKLDLSGNNIDKRLPFDLAGMTNLEYLNLSSNKLEGELYDEIGSLSKLTYFNVSFNYFSGVIPSQIFNHPNRQSGEFIFNPQHNGGVLIEPEHID